MAYDNVTIYHEMAQNAWLARSSCHSPGVGSVCTILLINIYIYYTHIYGEADIIIYRYIYIYNKGNDFKIILSLLRQMFEDLCEYKNSYICFNIS